METFTKLAGMSDGGGGHEGNRDGVPSPPPIPQDSTETDSQYDTSRRASRASLPINRRPSHHSFRSRSSKRNSRPDLHNNDVPPLPSPRAPQRSSHESAHGRSDGDNSDEEEEGEDFIWGPNHPCFPHPNPHCDPDSEEARTTRVIRVRRDWLQAGDLYPQYANIYPEILDPLVSDEEFRFLISSLNSRLKATFDPRTTRAWVDAFMGVATGFVWDDVGLTGAKKGIKGLEAFIERWNKDRREGGRDVRVVQLRRTGFMSLDFVVPDPGIDVVRDDAEEEEGGIGPAE